jgi:hypothetical protein
LAKIKKGTTVKEDKVSHNDELNSENGGNRGRQSSLSEERKLKRNASENLKKINVKNDLSMVVGGEKLRDKNS